MFDHLDRKQKLLFFALFVNFITLGISMTIFGATVPQIIDGFHWDYISTGIVMSAGALGGFLSTLACGGLLRRLPAKPLLAAGLGLLALSLVLFGKLPSAILNGIIQFLIGAGTGFSEVITNAAVVRMEKPGESRLMNLMHASFCVGAAAGPLAVGLLTVAKVPFGAVFTGAGAVEVLVIVLVLLQTFPRMDKDADPAEAADLAEAADEKAAASCKKTDKPARRPPWLRPLFWALVGAMFLYVGVELTYSNWISEFSARYRAFSSAAAALTVSVYWTGLLIGRLFLSFKYKGKRQDLMLAALAAGSVLFYAATALMPGKGALGSPWTWASAFFTGLLFSGCYPIIVSILGAEFKGNTTVLGILSAAAGMGIFLFPMATGTIASSIGMPGAILIAAGADACLAALAVLIVIGRRKRARLSA